MRFSDFQLVLWAIPLVVSTQAAANSTVHLCGQLARDIRGTFAAIEQPVTLPGALDETEAGVVLSRAYKPLHDFEGGARTYLIVAGDAGSAVIEEAGGVNTLLNRMSRCVIGQSSMRVCRALLNGLGALRDDLFGACAADYARQNQ